MASLTVLAEFDDGSMGDITHRPSLVRWSSHPDIVAGPLGRVKALKKDVEADITVAQGPLPPPAHLAHLTSTAKVYAKPPWSEPTEARFLAGMGELHHEEVPNVLFLPEGFKQDEEKAFERIALSIVKALGTRRATSPFNHLRDSINYWTAFVPSADADVTTLPEQGVYADAKLTSPVLGTVTGQKAAIDVPQPAKFTPVPGSQWSLDRLIREVGLPVPIDDWPGLPLAAKLIHWQTLYGVTITQANLQYGDQDIYADWKALAGRRLLNERDTAFGLALGERPRVEQDAPPHRIGSNPRRDEQIDLQQLSKGLYFAHKGPTGPTQVPIGPTWAKGGKDEGLVWIIVRSQRDAGTAHIGGLNRYFAATLWHAPNVVVEAGTGGIGTAIKPVPVEGQYDPSLETVMVGAHEFAHALGLDDEYGGGGTAPSSATDSLNEQLNVQAQLEFLGLQVEDISWLWPRIRKAGVLAAAPQPEAPPHDQTRVRAKLRPDHADQFAEGDYVRFRRRPLVPQRSGVTPAPVQGGQFKVVEVAKATDELVLEKVGTFALNAAEFFPGPVSQAGIVYSAVRAKPTGTNPGSDLRLIAPIVLSHLETTWGPLNAPADNPTRACKPDTRPIMFPGNLPTNLPRVKRARDRPSIVGLYEGGATYDCGVFHPAGRCLMRATAEREWLPEELHHFCHVCRYVIVDRVDPTKHGAVDADYERFYPEP